MKRSLLTLIIIGISLMGFTQDKSKDSRKDGLKKITPDKTTPSVVDLSSPLQLSELSQLAELSELASLSEMAKLSELSELAALSIDAHTIVLSDLELELDEDMKELILEMEELSVLQDLDVSIDVSEMIDLNEINRMVEEALKNIKKDQ